MRFLGDMMLPLWCFRIRRIAGVLRALLVALRFAFVLFLINELEIMSSASLMRFYDLKHGFLRVVLPVGRDITLIVDWPLLIVLSFISCSTYLCIA